MLSEIRLATLYCIAIRRLFASKALSGIDETSEVINEGRKAFDSKRREPDCETPAYATPGALTTVLISLTKVSGKYLERDSISGSLLDKDFAQ
jgi:hypothetical protein